MSESAANGAAKPKKANANAKKQQPHASKGGKGLAKLREAKRHRKVGGDPRLGITKPAMMRIGHRAGALRMSGIYPPFRDLLVKFMQNALRRAFLYSQHDKRVTVTARDCAHALDGLGMAVFGIAQ